jgi:lysophospholipase L1-like esterase
VSASDPASACRLGVLAFGDSITNGGGELQWGVALQSWALWTARGLGVPYTPYAVDGAAAGDVIGQQIPTFHATTARLEARWDVGCLYVGTNDVRRPDWDASRFAVELREGLAFLRDRCDRVVTATIPVDLGRPRPGRGRLGELNAVIFDEAQRAGALVVDLRDFGARNLMMTDHVHPTAFGQVAIAERALDVLAADGMQVRARPSTMIVWSTTWRGRLRSDLTYTYRSAKVALKSPVELARYRVIGGVARLRGAVAR